MLVSTEDICWQWQVKTKTLTYTTITCVYANSSGSYLNRADSCRIVDTTFA